VTDTEKSFIPVGRTGEKETDMSEFKHGSMETTEQEKTFHGFLKFAGYGLLGALVFLFFLGLIRG